MSNSRRLRRNTGTGLNRLEVQAARDENRVNALMCTTCKELLVTVDVDKGTAPSSVPCRVVTDGCDGQMQSLGYPAKAAQKWTPTHEWYLPKGGEAEALRREGGEKWEHVRRGGLVLREKTRRVPAAGTSRL